MTIFCNGATLQQLDVHRERKAMLSTTAASWSARCGSGVQLPPGDGTNSTGKSGSPVRCAEAAHAVHEQ